jgi:hypothetical protein
MGKNGHEAEQQQGFRPQTMVNWTLLSMMPVPMA